MTVTCLLNLSLLYHFVDSRLMQEGSCKTLGLLSTSLGIRQKEFSIIRIRMCVCVCINVRSFRLYFDNSHCLSNPIWALKNVWSVKNTYKFCWIRTHLFSDRQQVISFWLAGEIWYFFSTFLRAHNFQLIGTFKTSIRRFFVMQKTLTHL